MGPIFCPETSVSNCQSTPQTSQKNEHHYGLMTGHTHIHTTRFTENILYTMFRNFNSATLEHLTIDIPKFQMAPLPSPFFYSIRHPAVQVDEDNCEDTQDETVRCKAETISTIRNIQSFPGHRILKHSSTLCGILQSVVRFCLGRDKACIFTLKHISHKTLQFSETLNKWAPYE